MKTIGLLVAGSLFAAAGTGPAWADSARMTGEEITAALSGATIYGKTPKGKGWTVRYLEDGSAKFVMDDNSWGDQGKWWVEGDHYCAQWKKVRDGAKGCWFMRHLAGDRYAFDGIDGVPDNEGEIKK